MSRKSKPDSMEVNGVGENGNIDGPCKYKWCFFK